MTDYVHVFSQFKMFIQVDSLDSSSELYWGKKIYLYNKIFIILLLLLKLEIISLI